MKWLVQEFLNDSSNIVRIINSLEKCSVDYLLTRINKDNTLSVIDEKSRLPLDDSESIIEEFILNEKIMVYGSKTFAKIAQDMNLEPGSFMNERFEFDIFREALGNELLNHEFVVGELSQLQPIADRFFIRPTGNTKLFTGMVIERDEFSSWQRRENVEDSPYIGQALMISPLQKINAEYRFFVVNQEIVTGSSYVIGNKTNSSYKPSKEMIEYTQKIVNRFPLAEAFVVDIAETDVGLKVIEYNNFNTSGLYGCDELAIVKAINQL